MKLAMLSFRLPRPGAQRGGVERVAHDIASGLAARGHDVIVWSADPAPPGAPYRVTPLPGRALIHHWLGFRLVSGYLGNLLALLPDYRDCAAIIAHGDSLLLPLRAIPVLRIMHGSALDEARTARSPFRKVFQFGVYLQELLTPLTQETVAISAGAQRRYTGIRRIISNGVDTARFRPDLESKSVAPSILFVGTLGGRKRGELLIDWFRKEIQPAIPDAELWMVTRGGTPHPGVRFFPAIADDELAALYRRAWIFATPSIYEGFGLPYLEAMASGTPVIATANAGSREVLGDGRFGTIVENDFEFAPSIIELLQSPERRAHFAERGIERARDLSLDRTLDLYEDALTGLSEPNRAQKAHV